jgi:hypothetical protein
MSLKNSSGTRDLYLGLPRRLWELTADPSALMFIRSRMNLFARDDN